MKLIWVRGKQESFCRGDWTTQITLIGFSNFAFFEIANSVRSKPTAWNDQRDSFARLLKNGEAVGTQRPLDIQRVAKVLRRSNAWLACNAEKKQATQAVSQVEGASFADQFIEAAERHYIGRLSVNVIEMRLRGTEKR